MTLPPDQLESAIAAVPAGGWAIGVSGGADSVALLAVLRERADLLLHVVHLDHETRGDASTGDAAFVEELALRWGLPFTGARRGEIEPRLVDPPANPSARFRALRLMLFHRVVAEHRLAGVILAHHADDQAETVFQRLVRGSGYAGLAGMSSRASVGGLTILRPLLTVDRATLRAYLQAHALSWREDASNQSDKYLRNRLRNILDESPALAQAMVEMSSACRSLRDWARAAAPRLPERFWATVLAHPPRILADESARRWLLDQGVPPDLLDPAALKRLLTMASDAAAPARQDFPGPLSIRRQKGMIARG